MTGRQTRNLALIALAGVSLAACASVGPKYAATLPQSRQPTGVGGAYKVGAPYQVGGIWYVPREQPDYDQTGIASWYGDAFQSKPTANGEIFDKDVPSAAHTTLPMPCLVEVTNLDNGRKLIVRVNDRGPFVGGRIIDLSHEAARELGYDRAGLARVRVRYVGPAPLYGEESRRYAQNALKAPASRAAAAPPAPAKPTPAPPKLAPAPQPADGSEVILTAERTPNPPQMIVQSSLAPLIGSDLPKLRPDAPVVAARVAAAAAAKPFKVQIGAFSTPENAQKAVDQLAHAGHATVTPMTTKVGTTLYRVVLAGADDAKSAEILRQKAIEAGFADAWVMRP